MALPAPADIRANLEGYNIISSLISDAFITAMQTNIVIPFINRFLDNTLLTTISVSGELYSGNGTQTLILNRRYINSLDAVKLVSSINFLYFLDPSSIVLDGVGGILKVKTFTTSPNSFYSFFPKGTKNLQISYTYGFNSVYPIEINQAIMDLQTVEVLRNIEGRTGGGDLSTQGYSRNYGPMGKYSNYIRRLESRALSILTPYTTRVRGA